MRSPAAIAIVAAAFVLPAGTGATAGQLASGERGERPARPVLSSPGEDVFLAHAARDTDSLRQWDFVDLDVAIGVGRIPLLAPSGLRNRPGGSAGAGDFLVDFGLSSPYGDTLPTSYSSARLSNSLGWIDTVMHKKPGSHVVMRATASQAHQQGWYGDSLGRTWLGQSGGVGVYTQPAATSYMTSNRYRVPTKPEKTVDPESEEALESFNHQEPSGAIGTLLEFMRFMSASVRNTLSPLEATDRSPGPRF